MSPATWCERSSCKAVVDKLVGPVLLWRRCGLLFVLTDSFPTCHASRRCRCSTTNLDRGWQLRLLPVLSVGDLARDVGGAEPVAFELQVRPIARRFVLIATAAVKSWRRNWTSSCERASRPRTRLTAGLRFAMHARTENLPQRITQRLVRATVRRQSTRATWFTNGSVHHRKRRANRPK